MNVVVQLVTYVKRIKTATINLSYLTQSENKMLG